MSTIQKCVQIHNPILKPKCIKRLEHRRSISVDRNRGVRTSQRKPQDFPIGDGGRSPHQWEKPVAILGTTPLELDPPGGNIEL